MAGIARGDVEILVHATAPSGGRDDARYRALAQAYLDFEPTSRRILDHGRGSEDEEDQEKSKVYEEPESQASYRPNHEPESAPLSSPSQQAGPLYRLALSQGLDSPVLSFNSVLDNADSPIFRRPNKRSQLPAGSGGQVDTQDSLGPWQQPPSTIADSQPENNMAIATYSTPTRALETYLQQRQSSDEPPSWQRDSQASNERSSQLVGPGQQSQPRAENVSRKATTSRTPLPSAPGQSSQVHSQQVLRSHARSTPSQDPEDSLKRKRLELSIDEIQNSSAQIGELTTCGPGASSTPPDSRDIQRVKIPRVEKTTRSKEMIPSQVTTVTSSISSSIRSSFVAVDEIRPPPPPASMANLAPEMLLTESIQQLARKMPMRILYRPDQQIRDLRPMERGYWLVNCETWKEELRRRSWDCLGNFIGKGQAGWGAWCVRHEGFGIVRVYCWGALVGHIYLLLYMASEGKIKGTGACWIGGDGQTLVKMPA